MHRSTSSSNERIPRRHGLNVIVGSLFVFVLLTGGFELLARKRGFEPGIRDSMAHWSRWRDKVENNSLVFIGDSRITAGIDLDVFEAAFPERTILQLGIDATKPVATLEHLLADDSYSGILVCTFQIANYVPGNINSQQPWIDFYNDRWTLTEKFSHRIGRFLDRSLAMRSPEWGITSLIETCAKHKALPTPPPNTIIEQRSRILDLSQAKGAEVEDRLAKGIRNSFTIPTQAIQRHLADSEEILKPFLQRGGQLVYVVMPTSEKLRNAYEEKHPKESYWPMLVASSSAHFIHYDDLELPDLTLPDGSHLDRTSRTQFSEVLSKEIQLASP